MRSSGIWGPAGRTFNTGCATAFRSNLRHLALPIPPLNYGHDRWLHAVADAIGGRLVLEQTLQLYRRHEQNASEWVLQGSGVIAWKDNFRWSRGIDMRSIYANRREVLRTIEERLTAYPNDTFTCARAISVSVSELRRAQIALTNRINLLESSFGLRRVRAVFMLLRGEYRYFLGWRSFVKDLIR